MAKPLDVVAAVEQAKNIVENVESVDMHPDRKACIVEFAGQLLVVEEIRRLTTAIENVGNTLREGLEQL